ncbi:hypothetical protein [Leucobacter denitrificans]|uniref:Uncharacterized protein n=1 Tax=Leucobacter denitrificans TaxID=683042 RepID=A0A7G9S297_9MICO|nr:hypothetical protein [Leucobacter denitrificans]QNN61972.1 hypothetical protein H9L06_06485 [Leucobacter denitrificans]
MLAVDTHDWVTMLVDPGWISSGDYRAFEKPHRNVYFAGTDHPNLRTGWVSGVIAS